MEINKGHVTSWHIGVAAEAFAAGVFARCGYDVSVQYGANQPEYDLMISRGDSVLKVSVKGSQDGSWGLTQSELSKIKQQTDQKANYHGAIDAWLKKHGLRTVFCLVQFKGVTLNELPRIYIASPLEIAQRLKETASGRGDTILYESHQWSPRAHAAGTIERIPEEWQFSYERIEDLFIQIGGHLAGIGQT